MSTLEHQYLDAVTRFGRGSATTALAEWLTQDNEAEPLASMNAIRINSRRLMASTLTTDHIGSRVSFARVGSAGAGARIAGTLSLIVRAVRANGMPGYRLLVGGEEHGPLAPHHEVVVTRLSEGQRTSRHR